VLVKITIEKDWFYDEKKFPIAYYLKNNQFNISSSISLLSKNGEIIKDVLINDPILFVETTLPLIKLSKEVIECSVSKQIGDVNHRSNEFAFFLGGKVKGFSRLTSFEIKEYGISDDFSNEVNFEFEEVSLTNSINGSNITLELNDVNRFNSEFSLVGSFSGDNRDYQIATANSIYVKAVAWGVSQEPSVPAWIEYLVDAALNVKNHDYKMSALNYYSAYENFVSIIHDQMIFTYFAKKALKIDDEFKELKKFAQYRKRLSRKATDVAKHLNLFDNNLKPIISQLDRYSETRNDIAHGAATNINLSDVVDMAYFIFVYIHTIGSNTNITDDDWKAVVCRKNT
jgi:hypothetical protein